MIVNTWTKYFLVKICFLMKLKLFLVQFIVSGFFFLVQFFFKWILYFSGKYKRYKLDQ